MRYMGEVKRAGPLSGLGNALKQHAEGIIGDNKKDGTLTVRSVSKTLVIQARALGSSDN